MINHLRRLPATERKNDRARGWALQLVRTYNTNWIASPVRIEFLAGADSAEKLKLFLAYLEPFQIVDEREIPRQDWQEAERIAKRFGPRGGRRKLGDCLLEAISLRLNFDIVTADSDFKRRLRP